MPTDHSLPNSIRDDNKATKHDNTDPEKKRLHRLKRYRAADSYARSLAGKNDTRYVYLFFQAYYLASARPGNRYARRLLSDDYVRGEKERIAFALETGSDILGEEPALGSNSDLFGAGDWDGTIYGSHGTFGIIGPTLPPSERPPLCVAVLFQEGDGSFTLTGSGVLVGRDTILTARHILVPGRNYFVTAGPNATGPDTTPVPAIPQALPNGGNADLALLRLNSPTGMSSFDPIASLGMIIKGGNGLVAGYGVDSAGRSGVLLAGLTTIFETPSSRPDRMIAIGPAAPPSPNRATICQGDSGGPFYVRSVPNGIWHLAGIISGHFPPNCSYGALCTPVQPFL